MTAEDVRKLPQGTIIKLINRQTKKEEKHIVFNGGNDTPYIFDIEKEKLFPIWDYKNFEYAL